MASCTIGFIGGGNMAASMIGGLIANQWPAEKIIVSDPTAETRNKLQQQFSITTADNNQQVAEQADVIVLAIKPQIMQQVCLALAESLSQKQSVVISIAAGITCSALKSWLGDSISLVRVMPNTPALLGVGISGLYAQGTSAEQKALAIEVMSSAGEVVEVEQESLIDSVTAISGSGPAYFFLLMEAMEKTAQQLGLNQQQAAQLVQATANGAAQMAKQTGLDAAELRRRVTSPGGTTAAAINQFIDEDFIGLVDRALHAAEKRSIEMGEQFANQETL
ncbi:pyrroline-5-carboxylate reductase [Pelagibaculum spongiae]|uniref:Pyrroline-5-carboxylate reductase n=1 Tax=Pelagibaculum spongiae TaxID=2080658 RepID=A0A2V1H5Z4_9GAMM|nr:pyrroline-5-carboxylate reductase [Pelagibaculum spongiae]PVZ72175.1 pyrroline-5-carboxylate reductase [Pelagibaculum spongiae]